MNIITRAQALEGGLPSFFTGKPCKRGSVARRRTKDSNCLCDQCMEHRRLKCKRHYAGNAEALKSQTAAYRRKNPELVTAMSKAYYAENRDSILSKKQAYRLRNLRRVTEYLRGYRKENREALIEYSRDWRKANPELSLAYAVKRRKLEQARRPSWFGELDHLVLREAKHLRALREKATGIEFQIDHMIPLRCRGASGLHCASNIQVIPAYLNAFKKNSLLMTRPLEWLDYALLGGVDE